MGRNKPMLTVNEVAALTGLSRRSVIRIFERERGVFVIKRPETLHKRRYHTLRIPRAVLDRVMREWTSERLNGD